MGLFGKPPEGKPSEPTSAHTPPARPAAPAPSPAPAARPSGSTPSTAPAGAISVVGPNIAFKGEITGDEDVLVEGAVEGHIRISRELRVGPRGRVKATVSAQSVVVSGELVGDCEAAGRVEIQASGRLMGDIRAPKIVIAEGAVFRGNSDMTGRREERKDRIAIS